MRLENFAELEKGLRACCVVRYNRNQLAELIEQINASGYEDWRWAYIPVLMKPLRKSQFRPCRQPVR